MFQHQNPHESFADNDMPIRTMINVMQPIPVKRPIILKINQHDYCWQKGN